MVEDDEFIAELFERAAGDAPSAGEALARVRPRIRHAHRRRAAMRGSAGLIALVALGGLVSRTTHQPSERVRVGDTGTTAVAESTSTSVSPSSTLPSEVGPQTPPAAPATTVASNPAATIGGPAAAPQSAAPQRAAPTSVAAAKPAPTAKSPATTAPKAPASTSTASVAGASPSAPPPQVTSFDGQGGTVEVKYTDTSMEVESVSPSPGWSVADTKSDGASIEVTFQSDNGSNTGIEVHLDAAGRPTVDTPADPVDDVVNGLTGS